jgi:hypothetical protein
MAWESKKIGCAVLIISQYGAWEIKSMDGFLILHKGTDKKSSY